MILYIVSLNLWKSMLTRETVICVLTDPPPITLLTPNLCEYMDGLSLSTAT